jgi:hypothetical protein
VDITSLFFENIVFSCSNKKGEEGFMKRYMFVFFVSLIFMGGCASVSPDDYANLGTGETFYSQNNPEFMQIKSSCRKEVEEKQKTRTLGNIPLENASDDCIGKKGYERIR